MGWFCNTPEAKAQMKICDANKCQGCYKCVWIEESSNAMVEYGVPIEPVTIKSAESTESDEDKHPLFGIIKDKFNGIEVD